MSEYYDELAICEPRLLEDPLTGEIDPYYCGRLLLLRNVKDQAERCLGGTFLCSNCMSGFEKFMEKVGDAQSIDEEWDGS